MGTFVTLVLLMRIVATNTLKGYWKANPRCEQSLKSWLQEAELADWETPQELKSQFGNASILTGKRVVFNINGNKYRLIVDIEFRLQIIFVVWFGSHKQYDLIDSKTISYDKGNKD